MAIKKSKTQTIRVTVDNENPEPLDVIAKAVIDVANAFENINGSRLKQRAVVLLLHDILKTKGVGISQIEAVLDAAPKLKDYYIKQLPKK